MLYFYGDIHGEFMPFAYKLETYNIHNSIVVICGDIGIGFYNEEYYNRELGRLNKRLKNLNTIVYAIRGNHK